MRILVCGLVVLGMGGASLSAQDTDGSIERITLALRQPALVVRSLDPVAGLRPRTFGIFTIVAPEGPGEFIRVSVPIGALVSRAFKGAAAAKHRRQEAVARREVAAALSRFESQKPAPQP